MLNPACQEFQSSYERGHGDPHLETCEECRRFVAFVDGLRELGVNPPLEDNLRARLRRLPHEESGISAFPRIPLLPLPAALERRLKRIAREGLRESLPIWIRSPRYAIAASYLLTLLVAGTIGNPAAWGSEATQTLQTVGNAWQSVHSTGREKWGGIEERATENLSTTRDFLRASGSALRARWLELVESFSEPDKARTEKPTTENQDEAATDSDPNASI